jgi:hypothetical protein
MHNRSAVGGERAEGAIAAAQIEQRRSLTDVCGIYNRLPSGSEQGD